LSIEDKACNGWYLGATLERGVPRTAPLAEAGGDTETVSILDISNSVM
jgi:hypothetical protein